jgi:hypothetical protein
VIPLQESLPFSQICICGDPGCAIPYGLCHCGCGKQTSISPVTRPGRGLVRGRPQKYYVGHTSRRKGVEPLPDGLCVCRDPNCQIPFGTCHCGCGEATVIAQYTRNIDDYEQGSPLRFINGHQSRVQEHEQKHGHALNGNQSRTYRTWSHIIQRCTNQQNIAYKWYGGRGIKVCERWMKFENFLADMGERPSGKSIDRYPDNDGNYEPGNCRWATHKEQMNNTRAIRTVVFRGAEYNLKQFAAEHGITAKTLLRRIDDYGLTVEEAISRPVIVGGHVRNR